MKADRFSPDNALAFPVSFEETAGFTVEGLSRFARALKQARFALGWTQAKLSAHLAISQRSIVSWETAERIPSMGMVMLLFDALFPGEEPSLHHELISAYLADDLEREIKRRDAQHRQDKVWQERVQRVRAHISAFPPSPTQAKPAEGSQIVEEQADEQVQEKGELSRSQEKAGEQQVLEPLFALMAQLRHHPDLIPVTRDFLRELTVDE